MSAGCQNYNLFVSRNFLEVFNFHFSRRYFLLLFKKFRTLGGTPHETVSYVSGWTIRLLLSELPIFFELFRIRPKRSHTFGPEIHRFSKLQTTCMEEVLIVFFCADWYFRFWKFLWFWAVFLHFEPKKIRRVVKRAHYVSGGAFQGILFSKENISDNSRKNSRETRDLFPKNFRHFCQNSFLHFLWNFCMEEKNSRWKGPHISIFRGLSAKNQRNLSGKN